MSNGMPGLCKLCRREINPSQMKSNLHKLDKICGLKYCQLQMLQKILKVHRNTEWWWRSSRSNFALSVYRRTQKHNNRNEAIKPVTHICLIIPNLEANILTMGFWRMEEHSVAYFKVRRKDKYAGNGSVGRRWTSLWRSIKGIVGGCEEGAGWIVLF